MCYDNTQDHSDDDRLAMCTCGVKIKNVSSQPHLWAGHGVGVLGVDALLGG